MGLIKNRNQRVSDDMLKEVREIQRLRINNRLDPPTRPLSMPRITSAMVKEPEWKLFKDRITKLPRNPLLDKKLYKRGAGVPTQIIIIFVLALFFIGFMAVYWLFSLVGPPMLDTAEILGDSIKVGVGDTPNLTEYVVPATDDLLTASNNLEWITYGVFISTLFGFFIFAYFVRAYPFLIFIWFFFVIVFVVVAMYLSNSYVDVASNTVYAGDYSDWGLNDALLRNFPFIIGFSGVILGVVLLIVATRDSTIEESTVI